MTDKQIIELLRNRDERGIREAEVQYGQRLRRIAGKMLPDEDAEECVNDTFLALWNHVPTNMDSSLMPYLTAILKNFVRNRWRAEKAKKRNSETISLSDEISTYIADPRNNTEDEAIDLVMDTVNIFLGRQKPVNRQMFILRYWYGYGVEETAEIFHCSPAKVEKTLYRMRNALKKELKE